MNKIFKCRCYHSDGSVFYAIVIAETKEGALRLCLISVPSKMTLEKDWVIEEIDANRVGLTRIYQKMY